MQKSRHGKDFSHHNGYLLGQHSTPPATANPRCVLMGLLSTERKDKLTLLAVLVINQAQKQHIWFALLLMNRIKAKIQILASRK